MAGVGIATGTDAIIRAVTLAGGDKLAQSVPSRPDGTTIDLVPLYGADASGITPATGGSGLLGWLATLVGQWRDQPGSGSLNLAVLDSTYEITPNGYAGVAIDIPALAGGAVLQFEQLASATSSVWDAINVVPLSGGSIVTSTNAIGRFEAIAAGVYKIRVRVSTVGTGSVTIKHQLTSGQKLMRVFNTAYANLLGTFKLVDNSGTAITWSDPTGRPAGAQQFSDSNLTTAGTGFTLTITPPSGKRVYLEGFVVRWMGATAKADLNITLTNIDHLGGSKTLNWDMYVPAGITVAGQNISERFPVPLQAYAVDAVVTLVIPAPGTGNAHLSAAIFGFCA